MLYEFVTANRRAIIARSRDKLTARPWPIPATTELQNGVPRFLDQLVATLRQEEIGTPYSPTAIGSTAALHGGELLKLGFTVSQVVHNYGDICQAVTELAIAQKAPITTEEFHTLNRCLDTAIADAVTEHGRITSQRRSSEESERAAQVAHETRDLLNAALLAFEVLKRGTVAINGSTGAVLGRSLTSLRDLVESSLSEIRLKSRNQRRERISVALFLNELAVASRLHADSRGLGFTLQAVDPTLSVTADAQILGSAVTNLLNNAFKYSHAGGQIVLKAYGNEERAIIEVEDECGGFPETKGDPFEPFGDKRGNDRSGLGIGLSIARKAVRAHGGDINISNIPGKGCVFRIDLPVAEEDVTVVHPVA
ncbi:MAG: HAMP domain-containing sensor histidine kinase [Gammaproteobacteria bacterium]